MRGIVRAPIVGGVAALALTLSPAVALAATTIGQSPPSAGSATTCTSMPPDALEAVQLSASGNSYTVPAGGGIITSWRASVATGSLKEKLRVYTGNATAVTPVAESAQETVTTSGGTFPTRVPVAEGELLGFAFEGTATGCANDTAGAGDVIAVVNKAGPLGQSEPVSSSAPTFLLNISAQVEPDADGDGFGDESQDAIFTKTPKKKTKSENATFRFEGSASFQCRIDKKAFKPCTSPKKLHNLKVRKHKFQVRPVDAEGNFGPVDSFRWRVVD